VLSSNSHLTVAELGGLVGATILTILEKVKDHEVVPAHLDNFVVREAETVPAEIILDDPHISLYCLDDANQRVIFVETPPDIDLLQAPFYYDAQYRHAQRLLAVPYERFHQLADSIMACDLIFLYSTGRCGSTLISQALSTVEGVRSLSEPDIYTQIHLMRYEDKSRDAEYARLLKSCTRLLGRHSPILAIKFRGMCIYVGDLLYEAFPRAKTLFLYRDAETWARSMFLEFLPVEERRAPSSEIPFYRRSIAPLSIPFAARHGREGSRVEFTALMWLSMMEQYLALYAQGVRFLTIRYETIQAQPSCVLTTLFDYWGLKKPVSRVLCVCFRGIHKQVR
jgi:hypothetical protein